MNYAESKWSHAGATLLGFLFAMGLFWSHASGEERSVVFASPSKVIWEPHEYVDVNGNTVRFLYTKISVSIKEACAKEGDGAWNEVINKRIEAWIEEHMDSEHLEGIHLEKGIPSLPCNIIGDDGVLTFAIARPPIPEQ